MAEKVTIMVLKVDLQCCKCYKKVKKVLAKFPQIRDQIYNEKANTVAITVVCCSPEKIRDKICYKGGESIKSIEIVPPAKPKEPDKAKDPPKLKEPEKTKDPPPKPPAPALAPAPAPAQPPKLPEPFPPPPMAYQVIDWGPPPPPWPCYDTYSYGRPVYDSWGCVGGPCFLSRHTGECFSDDNANGCSIM